MKNLDSMIIDVEVTKPELGKTRVKFLAISGGCGPELVMDDSLAETLLEKLTLILAEKRDFQKPDWSAEDILRREG